MIRTSCLLAGVFIIRIRGIYSIGNRDCLCLHSPGFCSLCGLLLCRLRSVFSCFLCSCFRCRSRLCCRSFRRRSRLGCSPGLCLSLGSSGALGLAGLLYRLMEIHFHLCLTDSGLDQLADRCRLRSAAAGIAAAAPASAAVTGIAVACSSVRRSLLTRSPAAALCGCAGCAAAAVSGSAAGTVCAGIAAGSTRSGIIGTGAAGICAALSALSISTCHDDDFLLFGRFFRILSSFSAVCRCSFPLCTRCGCICIFFGFVTFRFKHVRTQLYCALLN